jgi:glycosyltransferase involved in cell wall biosynthesis
MSRTWWATCWSTRLDAVMKILLVSPGMPFPGEAGSPRTYNLARRLAARNDITLLLLSSSSGGYEGDLGKYGADDSPFCSVSAVGVESGVGSTGARLANAMLGNPWFATHRLRKSEHLAALAAVRRQCAGVEVVWVDSLPMLQYAEDCGLPLVVDEIDYMSRLSFAEAGMRSSLLGRLLGRWRSSLIRRYERRHLRNADAVVLISGVEADMMRRNIGVNAQVVLNGCDTDFFAPSREASSLPGSPSLLFVGNFGYEPNYDAARYILDDLAASIVQAFPEAKIFLVGPQPDAGFAGVPDQVEVVGFVDDVRPYYAGADVLICPLRYGTGVKNKMLEAGAMECAIVASDIAAEGIEFEDRTHFLRASTTTEYVERIAEAFARDGAYGSSLGRNARQAVQRNYSWASEAAKLESILARAAIVP